MLIDSPLCRLASTTVFLAIFINLCKRLFFLNGLLKYLTISHFHYPLFNRCGLFQLLAIFINVMLITFFIYFYFLNNRL